MKPQRIVIHCSASPNGKEFHVEDVRQWHLQRGFKDIGYHGVIGVCGGFSQGRPDDHIGAHVEGHNDGSLGVCMIGNTLFAPKQFDTLAWFLDSKRAAYKIPVDQVFGHYEFDTGKAQGKTCPNLDMDRIRRWIVTRDLELIRPYLLKPTVS